ncbi:MAG TPA: hypothetical protein PK198_27130 [Saprospiraceae bacterium]|nr:hypothetical protein [Saprospiraceae bacterium]
MENESNQLIFNKNTMWINFSTVWITECGKKLQAAVIQVGTGENSFQPTSNRKPWRSGEGSHENGKAISKFLHFPYFCNGPKISPVFSKKLPI